MEYAKSREAGFVSAWFVESSYKIVDGLVRPVTERIAEIEKAFRMKRKRVYETVKDPERQALALEQIERDLGQRLVAFSGRVYAPLPVATRIVNALGRLNTKDESAALAFVRTYGLLGYSELAGISRRPVSDPLCWIWAHAHTIRLCLELLEGLEADDGEHKLKDIIRKQEQAVASTVSPSASIAIGHKVAKKYWLLGKKARGNASPYHALAHAIVKDIINSNIKGIHPRLTTNDDGDSRRYRLLWAFTALIQVPYFQLARRLETGHHEYRVVRCQAVGCSKLFLQTDARQKFCPPDQIKGESRCAVRQRARDRRKRLVNRSK